MNCAWGNKFWTVMKYSGGINPPLYGHGMDYVTKEGEGREIVERG